MEPSVPDLLDVLAFAEVYDTGSYTGAAERMGLSKPVVSRRIARLERRLGARLFTRTARGADPTEMGRIYYGRIKKILADFEDAREVVANATNQVAGRIRLSAPLSFGISYLAEALANFAEEHPQIELDIEFTDHKIDLVGGGYDLAIRIGKLADSSLVARRIAPVKKVAIASPSYLDVHCPQRPQRPSDLAGLDALLYGNESWRFRVDGSWETVRGKLRMRTNNGEMLCIAAQGNVGVCLLPRFIAADAIASGDVEVILPDFELEEGALFAIMPPGRAVTARVRKLVDFLARRFHDPSWDPCWEAEKSRAARAPADAAV
ncbi:MAG TPA: LysR family transcriptional regulator [Allosphingosinicella sp.]|nr:LysR family transcriptional regulator [Allosphingosinicella sp.]